MKSRAGFSVRDCRWQYGLRGRNSDRPRYRSESRNTIGQDDAVEALRLTADNRVIGATRGIGTSNAAPKRGPEVRGQVRAILHLIREIRCAVPAFGTSRGHDKLASLRSRAFFQRRRPDRTLSTRPSDAFVRPLLAAGRQRLIGPVSAVRP